MSKYALRFSTTVLFLAAALSSLHATPSGLNNIPTADTTPQGTFVFQLFSTVGEGRDADLNYGFKTGLDFKLVKFEIGSAGHLYPGQGGPVTVHAKMAVPLGDPLPTLAVGVANVAFTESGRDRGGEPFVYFVASEDLKLFRVHAGVGYQDSNGDTDVQPFVGVDKTFKVSKKRALTLSDGKTMQTSRTSTGGGQGAGTGDPNSALETRDLFTLRADAIEQHNEDLLYSVGVLIPVCKYFVFETWGNFPEHGDPSVTLKGNVVLSF